MYPNLEAELARRKIKKGMLAGRINMRPTTLSLKINGKSPFTLMECVAIRNEIDPELSIDYLFKEECLCSIQNQ